MVYEFDLKDTPYDKHSYYQKNEILKPSAQDSINELYIKAEEGPISMFKSDKKN